MEKETIYFNLTYFNSCKCFKCALHLLKVLLVILNEGVKTSD